MQKKTNQQLSDLPQTGLLRLSQVLLFIPVSPSTWWAGCRDGRFPKPIRLSKRVTVWKAGDIRALIEGRTDFQENHDDPALLS